MPLYNYKCDKCKTILEKFQHAPDNSVVECNACGYSECSRVLAAAAFGRTRLNARDNLSQRIMPDVERIEKKINEGSDDAFIDIHGEK